MPLFSFTGTRAESPHRGPKQQSLATLNHPIRTRCHKPPPRALEHIADASEIQTEPNTSLRKECGTPRHRHGSPKRRLHPLDITTKNSIHHCITSLPKVRTLIFLGQPRSMDLHKAFLFPHGPLPNIEKALGVLYINRYAPEAANPTQVRSNTFPVEWTSRRYPTDAPEKKWSP